MAGHNGVMKSQVSPSAFQQALASGQPVVTAEISPPRGGSVDHVLATAEQLRGRVHALNVTDGSRAVMGMSSVAVCRLLLERNLEPVLQVGCRDRNRIALQADLLGAHALGLHNVLCLTGDPVKAGDQPKARPVFDYEAVRLLRDVKNMNQGLDALEQPLPDGPTALFPGCAADPQSPSWSGLKSRLQRKKEAGARFIQTQMVTDLAALRRFCRELAAPLGLPVLAGVFLLKSGKNARFINRMVPGASIPDEAVARLDGARTPRAEGLRMAAEQVAAALEVAQGVHIMAIKAESVIPQILDLAGVPPLAPPAAGGVAFRSLAAERR